MREADTHTQVTWWEIQTVPITSSIIKYGSLAAPLAKRSPGTNDLYIALGGSRRSMPAAASTVNESAGREHWLGKGTPAGRRYARACMGQWPHHSTNLMITALSWSLGYWFSGSPSRSSDSTVPGRSGKSASPLDTQARWSGSASTSSASGTSFCNAPASTSEGRIWP